MATENKYFTIVVVPEKTNKVRKLVIPSLVFKGFIATVSFLSILGIIMVLDYANVMSQITENKKLKIENRELKEAVQVFKDKIITMDSTLDRVKTFATKLKIITNIEDNPANSPTLTNPNSLQDNTPGSPPSSKSIPSDHSQNPPNPESGSVRFSQNKDVDSDTDASFMQNLEENNALTSALISKDQSRKLILSELLEETTQSLILSKGDSSDFIKKEFQRLDKAYLEVNQFADSIEQEVQYLLEKISEKQAIIAGTPTRLPTYGYVTSEYGVRINPYEGSRKMHEGIDIANRFGSYVIAPANGIIAFAGNKSGYGKIVVVDHGNGLETYFAHLSKYNVKEGARIKRGQILGAVGSSGHSTGPHLHYEVRANGLPVDPCWYILDQPTACRSR